MEREYQYWAHHKSGEVYAVELTDGQPTGACGPLAHDDRPDDMRDFDYNNFDGFWVAVNEDNFRLVEEG